MAANNDITLRGETLPPAAKPSEANKLERQAQQHYSRGQIAVVLFAADLARLQEGEVHKLRGYTQFGKYVENRFDGITAGNALQIVRQGQVLLKLEQEGRISLQGEGKNLPGTTGLRELSVVSKRFGDDVMVQTFDRALETGMRVTATSVNAALGTFIQAAEPPQLDSPALNDEEEDEEFLEADRGISDKVKELVDKIRDLSWELPAAADELAETTAALQEELRNASREKDEKWLNSKR